mgnify:FL=1
MKKVTVNASKNYDILIEKGLLPKVGGLVSQAVGTAPRIAIVTDDNVDPLYTGALVGALEKSGFSGTEKFVIGHGERSKSPETLLGLLSFLAKKHFTRGDLLIALGGGVVGDLCGFAASVYLRGIRFVQIPTTLLAAVDSSVGGKTAVDLPEGKNLIGSFYQPSLVVCDPLLLDSLPCDIYRDGFAEVIKYGVILDRDFFEKLKNPDGNDICGIIARSVEIKRDIVNADERDNGIRGLLNFGHTLGHGIELRTDFAVSHGAAVAIGMVLAARIAANIGLCDASVPEEIEAILKKYRFDTKCPITSEELYDAALSDKKRSGDKINLILPKSIGNAVIYTVGIGRDTLLKMIEEALSWQKN